MFTVNAYRTVEHQVKREEKRAQRARARGRLKSQGDTFFKNGNFAEAVQRYEEAIRRYGRKPVLLSNLAQMYLKLGQYEKAEDVATQSLVYDPSSVKARFRRGQARKERKRYVGAAIDIEQVLEQTPESGEAKDQLQEVREAYANGLGSASDGEYEDVEYEWPPRSISDMRRDECLSWLEDSEYEDSGTSDCEHTGNGRACRWHNGKTNCRRGAECWYSHAPDDLSVRDEIGKNVCLFYILGSCQKTSNCSYSHDISFLREDGWWEDIHLFYEIKPAILAAQRMGLEQTVVLELLYKLLYDAGYQPPRNLDLLLMEGTKGHKERSGNQASSGRNKTSQAPSQQPPTKSFIMVISLNEDCPFDRFCADLKKALETKILLHTAYTSDSAIQLLSSTHLEGVLLPDPAVFQHKHGLLASKLVEYAKAGGRVVFGGVIPCDANPYDLGPFFRRVWDLPWEFGGYTGLDLVKNDANEVARTHSSLPAKLSLNCVHLKGVRSQDSIYKSQHGPALTPFAHAKIGQGNVGYVGDVNSEEPSILTRKRCLKGKEKASTSAPVPSTASAAIPTSSSSASAFSAPEGDVLVISLEPEPWFDSMDADVLSALRAKTEVIQAKSANEALFHLESGPSGVFITSSGVAKPKHSKVAKKLVEYAKNGGTVVIGANFSGHITGATMSTFWEKNWGLPWKMGSYHRTTFYKNATHDIARRNPALPESFSVKAVHLKGIQPEDAVYRPTSDSRTQSLVFPSAAVSDLGEAPVVHRNLGKGSVGYIGDVNAEEYSTDLVLAMLGLLTPRTDAPKNAKTEPAVASSSSSSPLPANPGAKQKKKKDHVEARSGRAATVPSESNSKSSPLIVINDMSHSEEFKSKYAHLLSALQSQATVKHSQIHQFDASDARGLLISDPDVFKLENKPYIDSLSSYVKSGGRVVFAGLFSSLANIPTLDEIWEKTFGLPWKMGSYYSSDFGTLAGKGGVFYQNTGACAINGNVNMKAVLLRNASDEEMVYSPRGKNFEREAPVLFARLGNGFVGYVGDVDGKEGLTDVVLAMLNLDVPTES
ncbi:hypothetical protein D9758_012315 [Tetrapyrgos nigripes]|uniref:C3H1-type domain-containing protein n=1 Tax=Tetrapyrgos nigripes TaxID=182062 RepID=A0A8H5CM61_9AGAR|nr:hypothetical protein D9758_012315 [Tetrapyrgos nigripes]